MQNQLFPDNQLLLEQFSQILKTTFKTLKK